MEPFSSMVALNEAVAFELIAGTSFTPCRSAVRVMKSSSPATVEILKARTSSTNNRLFITRSEEHTSELQSRFDLVCRLLLEKKNDESMLVHQEVVEFPLGWDDY